MIWRRYWHLKWVPSWHPGNGGSNRNATAALTRLTTWHRILSFAWFVCLLHWPTCLCPSVCFTLLVHIILINWTRSLKRREVTWPCYSATPTPIAQYLHSQPQTVVNWQLPSPLPGFTVLCPEGLMKTTILLFQYNRFQIRILSKDFRFNVASPLNYIPSHYTGVQKFAP
jgi:hypothetical protein